MNRLWGLAAAAVLVLWPSVGLAGDGGDLATWWKGLSSTAQIAAIASITLVVSWFLWLLPRNAPAISALWQSWRGKEASTPLPSPAPTPPGPHHTRVEADHAVDAFEVSREHGEMLILTKIAAANRTATIYIDIAGTIQIFNAAAERITGYARDEVIGVNVSVLMSGHHARHHAAYITAYLQDREDQTRSRMVGKTRPIQMRRKDGTMAAVLIDITEINNGLRGFWGTFEPVVEQ